jgi:hypothetical protein
MRAATDGTSLIPADCKPTTGPSAFGYFRGCHTRYRLRHLVVLRMTTRSVNPILAIGIMFAVVGFVYGTFRRRLLKDGTDDAEPKLLGATAAESALAHDYGRVSISREHGYADKYRAYDVLVDDAIVGSVSPGEVASFTLPRGEHRIALKIDWAGSNTLKIDVSPERIERLQVRSNLRGVRILLGLWYIIFSPKSYLRLEQC